VAKQDADVQMRTPILYLCAFYPLDLKADERESLRRYVLEGGTLLVNCCGQDAAFASVREEMKAMFPKRPLRLLPLDHPLYRSHFRVERVSWPEDMKSRPRTPGAGPAEDIAEMAGVFGESDSAANLPRLRAVTVGTRAAVIVSLEDMACGWNQWDNRAVKRYSLADSSALGVNLMTYVMAELRFARYLARTHEIEAPTVRPRQQLALVQLVHDGNWDPNPSGVPYLLKELAEKTAIAVKFERRQFEVRNPDLFAYPLLYMTGTWDPNLSDAEVAILRRHLAQGGVLLADSASGRREFDAAFRKLVARILPDSPLRKAPAEHPVFHCFYSVDRLAVNHETEPVPPEVEVAYLEDRPVVLYSPLGLSDGWSQQFSAYARCYTTEDSMKLTANMIVYAMLTVRQSGDQK
jgi:hypothetical protein